MEYSICNRCVMDTRDPDLTFDKDGVCNYCRFADEQAGPRKVALLDRPWVIYNLKHPEQKYDCLIGLSGGVDSSYALHLLVENGIRPFAFTVDTGWNTSLADENIMRLVEDLKVPLYRYVINIKRFRQLQRAFIKSGVPNIEIPTDHILMATTYEMANKYGIKTIVSGGNWQTEGTMPPSYGYNARDLTHIKAIAKKFEATTEGLPTISLLKYLWYRNIKQIKVVNLLDHFDYNRESAKDLLISKYGWKDYGEKHAESKFTAWFQQSYLPLVHGIDKRRPHLSSLIHSGQMKREDALQTLRTAAPATVGLQEINAALGYEFAYTSIEPREHSDFPNAEEWWDRWSAFFRYLKKYGYLKQSN